MELVALLFCIYICKNIIYGYYDLSKETYNTTY